MRWSTLASIEESADTALRQPALTDPDEPVVAALPRYLVAGSGGQRVAFEMSAVREIIPARAGTRLPGAPAWVLGLLNLRGAVVTVMDLAGRLGLPAAGATSVVVLEVGGRSLGVRVDAVESVASAEDARVEPVEAARAAEGLVAGVVRLQDAERTALMLDARALVHSVLTTA